MFDLIVPLKDLTAAKSRLQGVLSDDRRRELVTAMGLDLVALAHQVPAVNSLNLVLGDNWNERSFATGKVRIIRERDLDGADLNELLSCATRLIGAERVLLLHGDLPFADSASFAAVARYLSVCDRLIIPDAGQTGTNGLAFSVRGRPEFRFGENSFAVHCRHAATDSCLWQAPVIRGFRWDIDTESDLHRLLLEVRQGTRVGARTADWVARETLPGLPPRGSDHVPGESGSVIREAPL